MNLKTAAKIFSGMVT